MEDQVIFTPLCREAIIPKRHSEGAAGYDLHSISDGIVQPHSTLSLNLGFTLKMPKNMIGILNGRSGFALKNGIHVPNSYVVDNNEVIVNLVNLSNVPFHFQKGVRITQIFFAKIDNSSLETENKRC